MKNVTAQSPSDLLRHLSDIDISVPARTKGRTKEHTQTWSICRFLAAYADSPLFRYPLRLDCGDRPDFQLAIGSIRVGIEVTEAVAADLAWADAIQQRDKIDTTRMFQRVQPGDPRLSRSDVEKIARGEAMGDGWEGDSVEYEWADVMAHFTTNKAERFAQTGFAHLDFNWLLVYDNWELPAVNQSKAASLFQAWLISKERRVPFDKIFVECRENLWQFARPHHEACPVLDLWADG
jgi:hypothetical protein